MCTCVLVGLVCWAVVCGVCWVWSLLFEILVLVLDGCWWIVLDVCCSCIGLVWRFIVVFLKFTVFCGLVGYGF